MLLAHGHLGVHQDPQRFFCRAACQPISPQHIVVSGAVPPQVQDFALPLAQLHEVQVSPFLQPLDGSTTLWWISHSSQFYVICKLAGGTLCPIIQIVNEDVKQYWTQFCPLAYTASILQSKTILKCFCFSNCVLI